MRVPNALWLAFLLLLASCAMPASRSLPKTWIDSRGRGFVDAGGRPFVPFGLTYYRPGTGWAPQVWKKFDADATRKDFARMKELGVNCVRVFLSYGSFYTQAGQLNADGLEKFDQFLAIAEAAGIYVHPTGPDLWEGPPNWPVGGIDDERTLAALESFWKLFAARYRGRNVIFAYDLRNEPSVGWSDSGVTEKAKLLEIQTRREHIADEWTRRQTAAIKSVDPSALVTVGLLQWSVPSLLPAISQYSAFRPARQARYLDFLTIHFYPLEDGGYRYGSTEGLERNLAYLEGVLREAARPGKPLVLGEFGWYGGGIPHFNNGQFPPATQAQQERYDRRAVETSAPFVCGWLHWGLYDDPDAQDCSELIGLLTADGQPKAWGLTFRNLAAAYSGHWCHAEKPRFRPDMDWEACLTSLAAENQFRQSYFQAFSRNP
jgi:hypothetical protein